MLLSCVWLSTGILAHSSTKDVAAFRLRRRVEVKTIRQRRRELNDILPSFSEDGESLVVVDMPEVTLLFRGLSGEKELGDKSYDAIQTSMDDYLLKQFENYFKPTYDFKGVETEVTGDKPFEGEGLLGGNAISLRTRLIFNDANDFEPNGKRQRMNDQPTFRASDLVATEPPKPETRMASNGAPSELELNFAAGHAWNDLSSFQNHLLVAALIDNISTFDGMQKIDAVETFPDNVQAEEIVVVEEVVGEEGNEEEEEVQEDPPRGDVQSPSTGSSLNIASANSAVKQSGTDRLNPLWPALIVGIAVFLFTIILLGYRKHKSRENDPFSFGRGRGFSKKTDDVMIHIINDTSTLEGDEEIEVEDTLYTGTPENSPNQKKEEKKEQRNLDKQYATSCLKPGALGLASASTLAPPSTSGISEDEEQQNNEKGSKNCLKKVSRRGRSSRRSLGEQDSMAFSKDDGIHIVDLTAAPVQSAWRNSTEVHQGDGIRRVDLTALPDQSAWRNPAEMYQEDILENGDMTKKEKKRFTTYIESGLTIEEASSQIMIERKAKSKTKSRFRSTPRISLTPPSTMTKTRSGDISGYTTAHRGNPPSTTHESVQSNPMGCFDVSAMAPCGEQDLPVQNMPDGTAAQSTNNYMSLGEACSAKDPNLLKGIKNSKKKSSTFDGNATAMVITDASSYASSYDDDDFERAMADAEAEMGII